uniref:Complement C2 n=1 Tax=Felis catus TaxID=9685 RepID=A0ABI7YQF5_FELCA
MAWPPLWPVLFVRQSGNTFHTPLSRSPSSVPPGPAARLRVRAKSRAEARLLGPAPRSRLPGAPSALRPAERAPARAPRQPSSSRQCCHLLTVVAPLWPSCVEQDRVATAALPGNPDRAAAIGAVGRCCPRVHPLFAGYCPNPGISVGAVRTGSRFGLGDKVTYRCSSNLVLTGSAERECQSNGVWSGTEPICRQPYSYDFPEDVAPALGASLSHLLGATNPTQKKKKSVGRKIQIQRSGHLNLYLLLDASQSVAEDDFHIFKESASLMVDRIFSFEINVSVAIITFASKPKIIMSVLHDNSRDATEVINSLDNVNYKDHENGTGTNTYAALDSVHIMMNNQMQRLGMSTAAWQEIRHAIILLTDGKSNMGGSPKLAVDNIKEILNINQQRNDYLDIYAIGVGKLDVDWKELNELGSKKDGERHAFILQDTNALYQVFEHMLDVSKLTDTICGVGNMSANASAQERTPWHVTIKPKSQETCRGALISDQWVLTAAHCFRHAENSSLWRVNVGDPNSQWGKDFSIEKAVISSGFDVFAKKNQGILEFYGDDIALLKLAQKVKMSTHARPICLPCTVEANLALRRPPGSTCRDHESELLNKLSVPAHFVALNGSKLNINLKTGTEWTSCIQVVSQDRTTFPDLTDVREVVTDQFLCSGTENDDNPCRGESGGAVFLERRYRFFQVGLVSWGLYNPCGNSNKNSRQKAPRGKIPPPRDFHINLFRLQPWLRQHLEGILNFLPL